MLVISRRAEQKLLFPDINVSINVLRVRGNTVKIGIEAPPELTVVREEVADRRPESASRTSPLLTADRKFVHEVRNKLNTTTLALMLLQKQLEMRAVGDAQQSLNTALEQLEQLNQCFAPPSEPPPQRSSKSNSHPKVRALLVEDDTNERELLAGFLRMSGFEVVTAADGLEAIDYLRGNDERPDVVLLDMKMPRQGGPETLEQIRSNPRHNGLTVFAVSGTSPEECGISIGGPQGVDRWIAKPLNPDEVVREISLALVT